MYGRYVRVRSIRASGFARVRDRSSADFSRHYLLPRIKTIFITRKQLD